MKSVIYFILKQLNTSTTSTDLNIFQVSIGGYSQEIGYLEYAKESTFPLYIIAIIAGIVVVVLLVIIVVVCVYRKRARASDEELKVVHMQMNLMDAKVAKICKEG